jgi:hypothetical protein
MGRFTDKALNPAQGAQGRFSGAALGSRRRPTSEISTITTRPVTERVPDAPPPAEFGTIIKAGFVDDPQAKIRIFAKDRFPNLPEEEAISRFTTSPSGEILFTEDGQTFFPEIETGTPADRLKALAGAEVARLPTDVGGTVGAVTAGAPGAAAGAGTGELIRKLTGSFFFGEDFDPGETAKDVVIESLVAGTGEKLLGGSVVSALERRSAKKGGKVALAAGRDRARINLQQVDAAEKLGKRFGIDLFTPQTTESTVLLNKFNLLGDLPQTADIITFKKAVQQEQTQEAVERFISDLGPGFNDFRVGAELQGLSQQAIRSLDKKRKELASPLFNEAFKSASDAGVKVDIKPVLTFLQKTKDAKKGTKMRASIQRMIDVLKKPDASKKAGLIADKSGKPFISGGKAFDGTLEGLHASQIELRDFADFASAQTATERTIAGTAAKAHDLLIKQMNQASSKYASAREIFKLASPSVSAAKEGLTGQISKLKGDKVANAAGMLMRRANSPAAVAQARQTIRPGNPDVWDNALQVYFNEVFDSVKDSASGKSGNIAGNFFKKTFGDKKQRKILKAAMSPEQFSTFEDFTELLRRVSRVSFGESTTVPRAETLH